MATKKTPPNTGTTDAAPVLLSGGNPQIAKGDGGAGKGWFLSFHCLTKYVKVTFFAGTSLEPMPPEASKDPTARYVHLFVNRSIDEAQLRDWIAQASAVPGGDGF